MGESVQSNAVRVATEAQFEDGVSFADLEARLGRDVPSVRSRARGEQILRVARLVTYAAPVVALLAPLGVPDQLGIGHLGRVPWMVYGETLQRLALVCFVLALCGQTWTLLSWWHLGRRRDWLTLLSSLVTLLIGVLWLMWLEPSPAIGGVLPQVVRPPIMTTVVLAAVAVGAQLFASQAGSVESARARARGSLMRVLSQEQQQSLLAERREVVEALRRRQLLDPSTAALAETLPLGDWWRLDAEGPEAEQNYLSSLANSTVLLQCLKALALVAPFGMMLLPIGNPGIDGTGGGMKSVMESEGFGGDALVAMALICAMAGVIGQAWTIFDWWRLGRPREGLWLAWSWTTLGSAVVTLVIFPFFLVGSWGMDVLTGPILAVAVTAIVALVLLYAASVPGDVTQVRAAGLSEDRRAGLRPEAEAEAEAEDPQTGDQPDDSTSD